MTMVWVDLKPGDGGCQPILDFLTEILPDTRSFDGCQDLKVYIEGDGEGMGSAAFHEGSLHDGPIGDQNFEFPERRRVTWGLGNGFLQVCPDGGELTAGVPI